eukprot:5605309-Pyramimonas_sp.AAC.1
MFRVESIPCRSCRMREAFSSVYEVLGLDGWQRGLMRASGDMMVGPVVGRVPELSKSISLVLQDV